ncbi:hypothetical protein BD626DRAFT_479084 [Schizophyllum amplum]|uniref:DUF1682-domain-containing protein n=1 Tax=Schizophyllum amplum TaxID=97359 RepID=A0A550CRW5_9AGAR|nr:hypothetical protein BD626DRAFT_479084 [Auriculariopsis ampla]
MSALNFLAPRPFSHPETWEGIEYKWKFLVFRPAYFQHEGYVLAAVALYLVLFFVGKSLNEKKASSWFTAHKSLLEANFSKPASGGLIQDGYSDFFAFSSGRRNVASLHAIFTLRPRHDPFQLIMQTGYAAFDLQYRPLDDLQLDFLLPASIPADFVWALVHKDELRGIKKGRWDLTFTRTTENPALPGYLSVMSEYADITENMFKLPAGQALLKVLEDPAIKPYFRSLSITDQPRDRPSTVAEFEDRQKHVILSLVAPPASSASVDEPLVKAVFALIDQLSRVALRPETKNKLRTVRADVSKEIKKEEAEKLAEESNVEDKKAAKRRAEEERIARLPAAEQQKILERERKRSFKKAQSRVTGRK